MPIFKVWFSHLAFSCMKPQPCKWDRVRPVGYAVLSSCHTWHKASLFEWGLCGEGKKFLTSQLHKPGTWPLKHRSLGKWEKMTTCQSEGGTTVLEWKLWGVGVPFSLVQLPGMELLSCWIRWGSKSWLRTLIDFFFPPLIDFLKLLLFYKTTDFLE